MITAAVWSRAGIMVRLNPQPYFPGVIMQLASRARYVHDHAGVSGLGLGAGEEGAVGGA